MPCMRGFMTLLNIILATEPSCVSIGKKSELRETLTMFIPLLELSYSHPSHISEITSPDLPHYYGYIDAAAGNVGSV